jgi:hypothetical protein
VRVGRGRWAVGDAPFDSGVASPVAPRNKSRHTPVRALRKETLATETAEIPREPEDLEIACEPDPPQAHP